MNALALVIRAMDQYQLGDKSAARDTYHQAEHLIPPKLQTFSTSENSFDSIPAGPANQDWLIAEILRREAKALIFPESKAP